MNTDILDDLAPEQKLHILRSALQQNLSKAYALSIDTEILKAAGAPASNLKEVRDQYNQLRGAIIILRDEIAKVEVPSGPKLVEDADG